MRSREFINESPELAEKYKAHLIKTLPLLMNFLSKTSKDYLPTEDEMLDVIETGYEVMLQYGDVNKAGEVVRNKLKSLISKEGVEEDTDYDNDKPLRLRANTDRVQKFIEAVYTRYPETFQNNHVMSWGSGNEQEIALFELIPNMNKPNAVEIKWIQAYPLRQGIGSRAMKILQSMAREHDVILTLYPWDKGQISQSKLIKFYRQMGFKPTTKGSKNMIWQGVSEGSYVEGGSITHESLYVDVPNEDWLQGKIDYAKEKGRDQWGVPFFNATTAYFTQDVRVPIQILRRLSGMRNEQKNVRSNDLKAIKKIMKDTGKLPTFHIRGIHNDKEYVPFIMVAYNGEAWVSEGNHRIMAAADLFDEGDKRFSELPIELKYFDGGERVKSGPLSPEKIGNQNVMEGSYREGGSITHDGVEYDFDSVMSIAEKMPTKTCSVDKLSWVLQYDTPNEKRVERADITVPLIVTKSINGKLTAIDGLHRLAKAVRNGVKTLPVKYIKPSELESAKLNKQGVAEGWSKKYKRSIDCNNPKGFSQRAHCQGRKKK